MAKPGFLWILLPAVALCIASHGQETPDPSKGWPEAISDNSFLIEEAYNQEAGVVQNIFTGWQLSPGGTWVESFTQEWPVPRETHQLSYSIAYTSGGGGSATGFGDVVLNYRYQACTEGPGRAAFAPRLSVILPSGSVRGGLGLGTVGWQVGLPVSKRVSEHFALHFNAGATYFPSAEAYPDGVHKVNGDLWGISGGFSVVALLTPRFNLFLEMVGSRNDILSGAGSKETLHLAYANPGFRHAFNLSWGQLVWGLSFPLGLTHDTPHNGVFLYFSIEAPMWKPKS
jgi:hypothetical protein